MSVLKYQANYIILYPIDLVNMFLKKNWNPLGQNLETRLFSTSFGANGGKKKAGLEDFLQAGRIKQNIKRGQPSSWEPLW